MTLRKSVFCLATFFGAVYGLAGCSTDAPADLRDQMVGMSEDQITDCMGQPERKETDGPAQVWTYFAASISPDTSTFDATLLPSSRPPDEVGSRSCLITVKLESAKVMAVDYQNLAATHPDEECSASIQRCAR